MDFYNGERFHASHDYQTPDEVYAKPVPANRGQDMLCRIETEQRKKPPYFPYEFRLDRWAQHKLWAICNTYIDAVADKPSIGVGTATASVVYAEGLGFDPNGVPFPQHADIIGWSDDPRTPDDEKKNIWMDKAQKMAPHFKYSPRPVGK